MEPSARHAALQHLTSFEGAIGDLPGREQLEARDFSKALVHFEQQLTESPDALEPKLCWVLCQLELNNVPVAALTAPLEDVFSKAKERPEFDRLSVACLVRSGQKLVERGQQRIAVLLLERGLELAKRESRYPRESLEALREELVALLEDELRKPDNRREARQHRLALEEKLRQIRALVFETRPKPPVQAVEPAEHSAPIPKKKPLNSKTLLESALSTEAADGGREADGVWVMEAHKAHPETLFESLTPDNKTSRTNMAIIGLAVCLVMLVGLTAYTLIVGPLGTAQLQLTMAAPAPTGLALSMPELQPLDPTASAPEVPGVQSLEKVKERLSNMALKPAATEPEEKPADHEPAKEPEPAYYDPKSVRSAPNGEPTIKEDRDPRKIPVLDPEKLAKSRIENMGSAGGRVAVPGMSIGSDGRPYGPPLDPNTNTVALDGSRVQGYPVEQLQKPLLYRTLAPTKVLDAPSVLAKPVDNLAVNAKVQVVSRMGKWLELRSTGGRRGYIFAQDAVEIRE